MPVPSPPGARELASIVASASPLANPAFFLHRRSRRALVFCCVASLAAHVVLLATLPGAEVNQSIPDARVLDVVLVEPPRPLPAAPEPAPPTESEATPKSPAPTAAPRTEKPVRPPKKTAEAPRVSRAELPPVNAPPEPPAEPPATQPPAREPAAAPSTPGTVARSAPSPTAETAITAPAFNAAYLSNPAPRYPLIARRNGEQGTVTLRVLVARDGTPERVTVEQTSGSRHLDNAALETVRTWRFAPARKGDEAIEAWVLVPIVFRLEGAS